MPHNNIPLEYKTTLLPKAFTLIDTKAITGQPDNCLKPDAKIYPGKLAALKTSRVNVDRTIRQKNLFG
jgi:hypothetical protein